MWLTPEQAATLEQEYLARTQAAPPDAPQWGTATTSKLSINACAAGARESAHTFQNINCELFAPISTETNTSGGFPVNLPTGALITSIAMHYFDNVAGVPSVGLQRVSPTGGLTVIAILSPPAFDGGNATHVVNLPTPHQVVNDGGSYVILAILQRSGATFHGIRGFEVSYRLQVSPAPGSNTFSDVSTAHPFHRFVEALVAAGITGGCGGGNYCPNDPVTRGQMAVFLSTALGLHFPN